MEMVQTIDEELEEYISLLDIDQKRSLLNVMKTFLPPQKKQSRFTEEELAKFYKRREEFMNGESETYSVEDAHRRIREKRKKNEV